MTETNVLEPTSRTHPGLQLGHNPARVLGKWFEDLISRHVPVGYEDETGFHYGMEPVTNEASAQCMFGVERHERSPRRDQ